MSMSLRSAYSAVLPLLALATVPKRLALAASDRLISTAMEMLTTCMGISQSSNRIG
jgi:hypothetical protein